MKDTSVEIALAALAAVLLLLLRILVTFYTSSLPCRQIGPRIGLRISDILQFWISCFNAMPVSCMHVQFG